MAAVPYLDRWKYVLVILVFPLFSTSLIEFGIMVQALPMGSSLGMANSIVGFANLPLHFVRG